MKYLNDVVCGRSEDVLRTFPDECIDLTVTSPPYDNIRTYNGFDLDLHTIGEQLFRITKNGGICCVVINDGTKNFAKSLTSFRLVLDFCDNVGWKLFETIIYQRHGRPGAWWTKRFRVDHEYIFIFLKGERPRYFNKEPLKIPSIHAGESWYGTQRLTNGDLVPIKKRKQSDTKCRGTIWPYGTSNQERNKEKMLHPATFPDSLANDLIICFSNVNDIVLDPLCGSGTTLRMAKKLKRTYIGIDISKEYCQLTKSLLEKE